MTKALFLISLIVNDIKYERRFQMHKGENEYRK